MSFTSAQWIGDRKRKTTGRQPSPFLRKSFLLRGPVRKATLHWTALGVADLHLNGQKIGQDFLMPGWSDYRKRTQTISTDVTKLLRPGPNRIGAILGDGWYCGYLYCKRERNFYGKHPQLLARLEVELPNGQRMAVVTDRTWELRNGPILSADLYNGETYDARKEISGWCDPVSTIRGWRRADLFPQYRGILQPKANEPVRVTQTLPTRKITRPAPGVYVFDFGQNLSGLCRLRIQGRRGQTVTLKFSEMLQADGNVYRENLRTALATDTYVCRGGGTEDYIPHFTFHGFRYVEVTGLTRPPSKSLLTALVLHTDMKPTGRFRCSKPILNRLNQNIRWGQRGNFLDLPTDCPQRDERLGWTGDAQVFIGTAAFHYDVRNFFRKWTTDLRDGQRPDGAYPDVAPDVLGRLGPAQFGNAGWADAGVICPWKIYWHYGDRKILEENYPAMVRWIEYQRKTSQNLIRPRTAYGDWLAIDAVTPQNAPVPCDLVGTAYFAHSTDLMARIAGVLGQKKDQNRFRNLHSQIVSAFQKAYVTPDGRVVGHCQTAYLLALGFDLLPTRLRAAAFQHLVDLISARNDHLTTGFLGTPLLCPVLTRFGRTDLAYRLLFQEDYPSWLYPIKNGATTMWERWNSYTKEHGFGDVNMNSFNHYAYGAVGEWMYSVIGGIRPLAPGFKKILFAPEPGGGLTEAATSLQTTQGLASCRWRLHDRLFTVDLSVPDGVRATLKMPGGKSRTLNPGQNRQATRI
ncbi:MAG: alpha-L-rhamnosidase [Verrucomicrobia bacterium]|nr:alpha-L-rhamnosidase [Verrucomicrobiota bacterium]